MRGRGDGRATVRSVPARAAAIVGLTVGLAACGAHAVHQSTTAASTTAPARVALRQQAAGGPVDADLVLECTTPVSSSGAHGGVAIASSTAQRWHVTAQPAHDWATAVDVAAGATCTATERPVAPAVLRAVSGGTAVYDGAALSGVRATVPPATTVALALVTSAAT